MAPSSRRLAGIAALMLAGLLAGCAGGEGNTGPTAAALPSGKSCKDVRQELDRLDARGVPARIESANAGNKLSPSQKQDVDRYNALLGQYLGARCHI